MFDKHNEAYMAFRAACKDDIVRKDAGMDDDNWPLYFDSAAMLDKRIKFLLRFIDDQLWCAQNFFFDKKLTFITQ